MTPRRPPVHPGSRSGLSTRWLQSDRLLPRRVVRPAQQFLDTEVGGGVLLLAAAVAALAWANSPWSESYERVWETRLTISLGPWALSEDLRHWVNDLLMVLFFFVVGLEIKREAVFGDLRRPQTAALPVVAALGGMAIPAVLYVALTAGGPGVRGWGIPMATDIAFALGVLALVGRRAPHGLRLFLLTLAIVDDIGAIAVIAVFYTEQLSLAWLAAAAAGLGLIVLAQRLAIRTLVPYVLAAGFVWLATYSSGVHATIAGVALALVAPTRPFHQPEAVADVVVGQLGAVRTADDPPDSDTEDQETDEQTLRAVSELAHEAVSPLARFENKLHGWSSYLVLPLFALANAGVAVSGEFLADPAAARVAMGVFVGLVLGKPLGIAGCAWLAIASGRAQLPGGVSWRHLIGAGALAGIGFTVSLFITGLAFTDPALVDAAKTAILGASLLAGVVGALWLFLGLPAARPGREL
ncbi:MAG: Na+/H+ antiporter NhaA, partial [Actinomycetota bacterium]|nr:Na+/H+ antiporter NhaA [Actinomycetota bacterium]